MKKKCKGMWGGGGCCLLTYFANITINNDSDEMS